SWSAASSRCGSLRTGAAGASSALQLGQPLCQPTSSRLDAAVDPRPSARHPRVVGELGQPAVGRRMEPGAGTALAASGSALEAADSSRNVLTTLDHTCSAASLQYSNNSPYA